MNAVITTSAAQKMLAEARTVLDVKDVRDKAEALRTFAQLAQNREMEISAGEIRVRAERRLGQMLVEIKKAGGLSQGGRPGKTGSSGEPVFDMATLDELGIDKKLSMRAQQLAGVTPREFERRIAEWRAEEMARSTRAVASLFKRVARPQKPSAPPPLPDGRYAAIYADPPWRYETWSDAGMDRSADNHYPTMSIEEICALPVAGLAADDAVLFLWATGPMLREALRAIDAWGFTYKTIGFTWGKTDKASAAAADPKAIMGNGYWTRSNAELCLLATRGRPRRRATATDVAQLVLAPRGRHSEKPAEVADRIERLVEGPYIELFARATRDGWDAWGHDAGGDS